MVFISWPVLQAQESYTVTSSGFTFTPAVLNGAVGDTIRFDVGSNHTATQVSEATWNADGTEPLEGGFNFTSGTGVFVPEETGTVYYVCEFHVSLGMKGKINVSGTSSEVNITTIQKPEVFPNPASDILYLKSSASAPPSLITVYDMTGKVQLTAKNPVMENNIIPLQVQDLHEGVYFVKLKYPGRTWVLKFIKL